jgi:hypothetical protein
VIALPPVAGATNATEIEVLPLVSVAAAGAVGTVAGTAVAEADDASESPTAFVATTAHVYDLPLVKANTMIGEAVPVFDPVVPPSLDVHVAV